MSLYNSERTMVSHNATLSTKRLEATGFDPRVTSMTPQELLNAWLELHDRVMQRPKAPEKHEDVGPIGLTTKNLTMASFYLRPDFVKNNLDRFAAPGGTQGLLRLLATGDMHSLAEKIFANGLKDPMALARTCTEMWARLTDNIRIWDMMNASFHFQGSSGVFIVVTPECTIGDVLRARDRDPEGIAIWNVAKHWWDGATAWDTQVLRKIRQAQGMLDPRSNIEKKATALEELGRDAMRVISCLAPPTDDFWLNRQAVLGKDNEKYQPPQVLLGSQINALVCEIFEQRKSLKVLHFEKTELLDTRLLAVILRSCPNVTMLGVYNCPLVHFGDIICLLDLIHEINESRVEEGRPKIRAFDFFPRYQAGMPFDDPAAATYGLSWDPLKLEIAQRGFYTIILKAFMKAHYLDLDVLFDEGAAFRDYLFHVPNVPFGVPCFLDALYRLMDIQGTSYAAEEERKKTVYDLLMPVRMHLGDNFQNDRPEWYRFKMTSKFFCTSCGYEMLADFYTGQGIQAPPKFRACAGCFLQTLLDQECHHLLVEKKRSLDVIFPEHDGKAFNMDAPMPAKGNIVICLKTTQSKAPTPPPTRVLANGTVHRPQYVKPFVRDQKKPNDGLCGLPTLENISTGHTSNIELWKDFKSKCLQLDALRVSSRMLIDQQGPDPGEEILARTRGAFSYARGKPDHWQEKQRPDKGHTRMSHTFATALQVHLEMVEQGFQPGGRPDLVVDEHRVALFESNKERAFW